MSDVYRSLNDKPFRSGYLYAETSIEHPVQKVWPHALNIGRWMNDHRLETVAGEPGKVGYFERVYPRGLGNDVGPPHYHLYGIGHIIPYKYIGLEVFSEKGGSYGDKRDRMSFDAVLLVDCGNSTRVIFLVADVYMGREEKDFSALQNDGGTRIARYFENLRQQVNDAR